MIYIPVAIALLFAGIAAYANWLAGKMNGVLDVAHRGAAELPDTERCWSCNHVPFSDEDDLGLCERCRRRLLPNVS